MSRTVIGLVPLLVAMPAYGTESLPNPNALTRYQALTRGEPDCLRSRAEGELVVCGRREADRYRVPLVEPEAGNPAQESVSAERERLQHQTTPCEDLGPFLVECGMVGVSTSVGFGASGTKVRYRKLAD